MFGCSTFARARASRTTSALDVWVIGRRRDLERNVAAEVVIGDTTDKPSGVATVQLEDLVAVRNARSLGGAERREQ